MEQRVPGSILGGEGQLSTFFTLYISVWAQCDTSYCQTFDAANLRALASMFTVCFVNNQMIMVERVGGMGTFYAIIMSDIIICSRVQCFLRTK